MFKHFFANALELELDLECSFSITAELINAVIKFDIDTDNLYSLSVLKDDNKTRALNQILISAYKRKFASNRICNLLDFLITHKHKATRDDLKTVICYKDIVYLTNALVSLNALFYDKKSRIYTANLNSDIYKALIESAYYA